MIELMNPFNNQFSFLADSLVGLFKRAGMSISSIFENRFLKLNKFNADLFFIYQIINNFDKNWIKNLSMTRPDAGVFPILSFRGDITKAASKTFICPFNDSNSGISYFQASVVNPDVSRFSKSFANAKTTFGVYQARKVNEIGLGRFNQLSFLLQFFDEFFIYKTYVVDFIFHFLEERISVLKNFGCKLASGKKYIAAIFYEKKAKISLHHNKWKNFLSGTKCFVIFYRPDINFLSIPFKLIGKDKSSDEILEKNDGLFFNRSDSNGSFINDASKWFLSGNVCSKASVTLNISSQIGKLLFFIHDKYINGKRNISQDPQRLSGLKYAVKGILCDSPYHFERFGAGINKTCRLEN